jgi:hypothetical protein
MWTLDIKPLTVFLLLVFAAIATLLQPLLRYYLVGWRVKRADIMDGLTANARRLYFAMFCGDKAVPSLDHVNASFEKLYDRWYGRRFFVVPGILLFLVVTLASVFVVLTILDEHKFAVNPLFNLPPTAVAALSGAYLWVVNDHIGRARRLDFSPSDVMWSVLRMVIALPMGYALSSIVKDDVAPFVAFAGGAFPLATLLSVLRRLAAKQMGTEALAEENQDNIIKLQGINKVIVERLSDEDVTTVTQVAYCDPVRLTMRSNLTFNFVTDCMNQALAWMYLEDSLDVIRPLGMRGAVEIKYLMDSYDTEDDADPIDLAAREDAQDVLPLIAAAIKQSPSTLLTTFRQVAEDPFTIFLAEIWTLPSELEDST